MKKNILCFFLLLGFPSIIFAQRLSNVDMNKYSINLPEYWGRGNKIWQILNDKLPVICEELKDKELCGDGCNPKYTVEFEMSDPIIYDYYPNHISSSLTTVKPTETWEFTTYYGFECSLLLFDNNDKLISRLILVDTNETWKVSTRASLAAFAPARTPVWINMYAYSNQYQFANSAQQGQTPYSYINNNKEDLSPTRRDMLNVIDKKIKEWR